MLGLAALGIGLLARNQFQLVAQLGDFLLHGLQLIGQLQPRALVLLILLLHLLAQIQDGAARFIVGKGMGGSCHGRKGQAGGNDQSTQGQGLIAHENIQV
ncbi:Uncharacterised protein [Bordetella pertussis]|nr:Uncharacterised protein [Bordetella pertussis]CFE00771.1 Uncharacterised protein [Bordetella pertussis]CFL98256.1 Uncharacterised protein [Bordetella pertussis]CFM44000.1 Uncharacterised protein [Bordetella pertussis]CFN35257.1 Uncharacterised protein [Bordetella pertussis]